MIIYFPPHVGKCAVVHLSVCACLNCLSETAIKRKRPVRVCCLYVAEDTAINAKGACSSLLPVKDLAFKTRVKTSLSVCLWLGCDSPFSVASRTHQSTHEVRLVYVWCGRFCLPLLPRFDPAIYTQSRLFSRTQHSTQQEVRLLYVRPCLPASVASRIHESVNA